jgi:large subunit ribosomal protein L29
MITAKELRERETTQVEHELAERYKHLFELRSQAVTEKLEDPTQLRKTKKDIARILTVLTERRNAEKAKNQPAAPAAPAKEAPAKEASAKKAKAPKAAKKKTEKKEPAKA